MFTIRKTRDIALLVTLSVVMMLGMMMTRARLQPAPCCLEGRCKVPGLGVEEAAVLREQLQLPVHITLRVVGHQPRTDWGTTPQPPTLLNPRPNNAVWRVAPKNSPPVPA